MIPKQLLNEILEDDYYRECVRHSEGTCAGRITFEHCFIYAGRQVQEKWAIIPLCEYHHDVNTYQDSGDLKKELNWYYSLQRATVNDFHKYPRKDWSSLRRFLVAKYGPYK
jgi:hypothetical protein